MSEQHSTVEYRDVPDFPGYRIGNDGTVLTGKRNIGGRYVVTDSWRPMKPRGKEWGHLVVILTGAGRRKHFFVHALVLTMFVGPCPPGLQCRHLDGDPANNNVSNLCWGTCQDNADDRKRHGTVLKGERVRNSKLTADEVLEIRRLRATGVSLSKLRARFGVTDGTICRVVQRKGWKHV